MEMIPAVAGGAVTHQIQILFGLSPGLIWPGGWDGGGF